jgi:hypothetical protein
MAGTARHDSEMTLRGGIRGFAIGAVSGAVLAILAAMVMAHFNMGTGGPGLHAAAGAAFGGGIGFFWGILAARHR